RAVNARLAKTQARLVDGDQDVGPLMDVVRQLSAKRDAFAVDLAKAQAQAASPAARLLVGGHSALDALAFAPDPREARLRLRAILRRLLTSVHVLLVPRGRDRLAAIQVHFVADADNRSRPRTLLVWHRNAQGNVKFTEPAVTRTWKGHGHGAGLRR